MCRALPRAPCLRCTLTPHHQATQISPSSSSQQPQPSGGAAGVGWVQPPPPPRRGQHGCRPHSRLLRPDLWEAQFPSAHPSLPRRINVVTGDPQVLASVGSLLIPGPLALALLPLHASAAGAAVVRRAPVFLTEDGRRAMRLHWMHQKQQERLALALCCPASPSAVFTFPEFIPSTACLTLAHAPGAA